MHTTSIKPSKRGRKARTSQIKARAIKKGTDPPKILVSGEGHTLMKMQAIIFGHCGGGGGDSNQTKSSAVQETSYISPVPQPLWVPFCLRECRQTIGINEYLQPCSHLKMNNTQKPTFRYVLSWQMYYAKRFSVTLAVLLVTKPALYQYRSCRPRIWRGIAFMRHRLKSRPTTAVWCVGQTLRPRRPPVEDTN